MITIVLPTINCSAQVGDIVYFLSGDTPTRVGTVTAIGLDADGNDILTIDENNPAGGQVPLLGDYILFIKNQVINMNGLSGYYADVVFENNSKVKAELFAVGSEVTESSK